MAVSVRMNPDCRATTLHNSEHNAQLEGKAAMQEIVIDQTRFLAHVQY